MIDFTIRAANDFDISFSDCSSYDYDVCPVVNAFTPVWSSVAALDNFAFLFMDNDSSINLPSITSPPDAFDASLYYHDLHVMTDT